MLYINHAQVDYTPQYTFYQLQVRYKYINKILQ